MKNYFVIFFREKEREIDKQGSGRRFMIQKDSNQRIPMKKKCHILYVWRRKKTKKKIKNKMRDRR